LATRTSSISRVRPLRAQPRQDAERQPTGALPSSATTS
jgi:hypothetical protein